MVARELSFNILIGAARASGVDQVFGGVNRRITQTRMELAQTLEFQKSLNAAITEARRAGENYQPLQDELRQTNARVDELNQSIQEQQAQVQENSERTQRWGRRMRWVAAGAAALSAALIALVQIQGEYSRSLVNAAQITGMTAEEMERMDQAARRLTGESLSPEAWVGVLDSMRQLQHQFRLGTDLSEDQLIAFQRLRLNPYQTAAFGAREWYEALLNVAPEHRAITAAAVPGLSAIFTALRPALEQNQSWNEVLAETVALSDETHQRYADTQRRLGDVARGFRDVATEGSGAFLPLLEDILNVIVPVVRGFSMFVEQNPNVVRALAAIGIGLGAVTTALWLANVAATFFAAVSGVGLPLIAGAAIAAGAVAAAGGVAFALGGGIGGAGSSAAEQQEAAQAEAESRQRANDNANADRVVGAIGEAQLRNEAVFERSRQELDPILRGIECLENAHADEPADGVPDMAGFDGLTSAEQARLNVAQGRQATRVVSEFRARVDRTGRLRAGEVLEDPFERRQQATSDFRARVDRTGRLQAGEPREVLEFPDAPDTEFRRRISRTNRGGSDDETQARTSPSGDMNARPDFDIEAFFARLENAFLLSRPAQAGEVTVTNNFYDTPDPAGEIVRETEVAIGRVNTRR